MKNRYLLPLLLFIAGCSSELPKNELRPSSYPLVTIDPYTNAWSPADHLYDSATEHWTGKPFPLLGVVTVDGVDYRFMGVDSLYNQAATQLSAEVQAMNTYYSFAAGPVELSARFTAPLFMEDLDLLSRPVNYMSFSISSTDGAAHEVSLLVGESPLWCVDSPEEPVWRNSYEKNGLSYQLVGTEQQNVLGKKGDDVRINWGYAYLTAPTSWNKADFRDYLAFRRDFGKVSEAADMVMVGYDDIYSIDYFGTWLRPWWNRDSFSSIEKQFEAASTDYQALLSRSEEFDKTLRKEAIKRGGVHYADLCAVAYRQAVTAHKLVQSPSGEVLWFSKENNSNGSIGTVDVTYPSAPLFLKYNPELAKGLLNHIFEYSESGRWTKPFPAHDVGTYPIANGQTYPYDMPVEEAGNMLILTGAVAILGGDRDYAAKHWETLSTWAEYLSQFGYNPDNQLCTDDFAGRLAHNVNLSAKAILALAAYGKTALLLGHKDIAKKYLAMAKDMAGKWQEEAFEEDHYLLTFDSPGTWSQKYNLAWDKVLNLNIFPDSVRKTELSYYLKVQNEYGLPLDSRKEYTKIDWILWSASMAKDPETFEALVEPVWRFENETPDRVPMGDWVWTDKPKWQAMKARSVVGGLFMPLL